MSLGLRRLAVAAVGVAAVIAVGARTVAVAVDAPPSWSVTVGSASRPLLPGGDTTMTYEVRNTGSQGQQLRGTTVEVKNDGVDVYDTNTQRYVTGCLARWFHVVRNDVPSGADAAPDGAVRGSLVLAFDDAPESQDACQAIGVGVSVTTT